MTTETLTFVGETSTQVFDGFAGFRIDQRYTGVVQDDGRVLVSAVGAPVGTGVVMSEEEFGKWFKKA